MLGFLRSLTSSVVKEQMGVLLWRQINHINELTGSNERLL
jgi:hypothetical protein